MCRPATTGCEGADATLARYVPALRALHRGNPLDDGCVDWLAQSTRPQEGYLLLPRG